MKARRLMNDAGFWDALADDWAAMTFAQRRALLSVFSQSVRTFYAQQMRRARGYTVADAALEHGGTVILGTGRRRLAVSANPVLLDALEAGVPGVTAPVLDVTQSEDMTPRKAVHVHRCGTD